LSDYVPTFNLPKNYFASREEEAFIYLIDPQTSERVRAELLGQVLYQPLYHLTESVALRYAPCVGILGEDELVAQAFEDLCKKYHKFSPWKLDKTGKKILRAYSYLSTIVKNFSLGYAKKASDHDATHQSFDSGAPESQELGGTYHLDLGEGTQREMARDQRMQRVLEAIRRELAESRTLRVNDAAVGRALLVVLESSANQTERWNDERITRTYLRDLLVDGVFNLTQLSKKEINTGFRRFEALYENVCAREGREQSSSMDFAGDEE
jgi:hypothetical protein